MDQAGVCNALHFAAAFELYWPYAAYCLGVTWAYAKALWRSAPDTSGLPNFFTEVQGLFASVVWSMAFKAVIVWVLGGSILLALSVWICQRSAV